MDVHHSDISSDLRETAAYWFTRMHSGEATQEERAECAAWQEADPAHRRAYEQVDFAWESSLAVPEKTLRTILAKKEPAPKGLRNRRNFGLAAAGTVAALAIVAFNAGTLLRGSLQYTYTLTTTHGGREQVKLPDGSMLYANTDTEATVTFYGHQREVKLEKGEIFLEVARDQARPFIVNATLGTVKVTGTRFNVRYDDTGMDVAVVSGSVEVSTGSWSNKQTRTLTKGMTVAIDERARLGEIGLVDMRTVTAWQRGRIIVENMPLVQVVKELNRYLPAPALLIAPRLSQYRVTGTFDASHPESLLEALPNIAPVSLYQLTDGRYRIVER